MYRAPSPANLARVSHGAEKLSRLAPGLALALALALASSLAFPLSLASAPGLALALSLHACSLCLASALSCLSAISRPTSDTLLASPSGLLRLSVVSAVPVPFVLRVLLLAGLGDSFSPGSVPVKQQDSRPLLRVLPVLYASTITCYGALNHSFSCSLVAAFDHNGSE